MRSSAILITLATAGLLAACGQKGPLYLPDPAQGARGTAPTNAQRIDDAHQAADDDGRDGRDAHEARSTRDGVSDASPTGTPSGDSDRHDDAGTDGTASRAAGSSHDHDGATSQQQVNP